MAEPPTSMHLLWRGGLGPDFEAKVDEGVLTVQSRWERSSVRPSARDWDDFFGLVREVGACDWELRYSSSRFLFDCISWEAEIEAPGISVRSGGYDAFPSGDGLARLLDLVAALAGVSREH